MLRSIRVTLEMIKWEHSIFALPFALTGAALAAHGFPPAAHVSWLAAKLGWIVLCMISARSAAMAFNRWADADLDAANPRTKMRAIPAGLLTRGFTAAFTLAMSALFVFGAWRLNRLTLILSPIILVVLFFYSYTKRFTRWSHLFLGLALGLAPTGAWIAIRGSLDPRILVLTAAVLFWVAGFDVLYACQDEAHDRSAGLFSIPATLGLAPAFWIARAMHLLMLGPLIWLALLFHLGPIAAVGILAVAALLLWEHTLVSPRDLTRLNAAFFTMNGVIAVIFFVFVAADLLFRHHA
ncbi:MAG: UbiA-like polyprenyltransferase [Acidobacteriota bacterium]